MADVHFTCSQCACMITVSEYAELAVLKCEKCGSPLVRAGTSPLPSLRRQLTLKSKAAQPPADGSAPKPPPEGPTDPVVFDKERDIARSQARHRPARQSISQNHVVAWCTFIILGGLMGFLRYGPPVLPAQYVDFLRQYGIIIALAFHLIIMIKAFTDSMLQGVLCIFVPLYSVYYVFLVSDDFLLRAIFAGFLVGIGQDSAVFLQKELTGGMQGINAWIRSGG